MTTCLLTTSHGEMIVKTLELNSNVPLRPKNKAIHIIEESDLKIYFCVLTCVIRKYELHQCELSLP